MKQDNNTSTLAKKDKRSWCKNEKRKGEGYIQVEDLKVFCAGL